MVSSSSDANFRRSPRSGLALDGDDEHVGSDIDALDQTPNQIAIVLIGICSRSFPEGSGDRVLNFNCGNTIDGSGKLLAALQQARGNVISILASLFAGVAWPHQGTAVVEYLADQGSVGFGAPLGVVVELFGKLIVLEISGARINCCAHRLR